MSPLACLLLALAAVLPVAIAKTSEVGDPDIFCGELSLGYRTANSLNYEERRRGGPLTIPDNCTRPGNKLVGVYIFACNPPHSKPEITDLEDPKKPYRSLYIDCPSYTYGCESLKVNVTEYCEPIKSPVQG